MMHGSISELQLSLIVIGVVAVGGVWGYNVWQERRHRKLAQQVFRGQQNDVLMRRGGTSDATDAMDATAAGPGAEPVFGDALGAAVNTGTDTDRSGMLNEEYERIEPVFSAQEQDQYQERDSEILAEGIPEPIVMHIPEHGHVHIPAHGEVVEVAEVVGEFAAVAPSPAPTAAARVAVSEAPLDSEPPPELADDIVDCIIHLNAADLVAAPLLWAAQRQLFGRLSGRLRWSGLDENTGRWQQLHANDSNSYRRLVAALQLADRNGPIDAADLSLFCDGVRQLAAHYQAQVIVPVVADVLIRAQSLDEFCAAVDWCLGINLVHRDGLGLPLGGVWQLAEAAGLQRLPRSDDGLLHALDEHGQTLFTLGLLGALPFANEETMQTASGVTLTIDVPRVADGSAAFDRMLGLARHIVTALDAVLVDDQRMPLSDEVLNVIRAKIGEFQQKMAAHQIPAGGRRALRLYS